MSYPASIPSFSAIQGTTLVATDDHANRHNTEGSAITALATVLGTTNGTSVLKDFSAGQFPIRSNAGGTLIQEVIGGTLTTPTIGTPSITGGTLSAPIIISPTIGTPTLNAGTINNPVMGTPAITGGTATNLTLVNPLGVGTSQLVTGTRDLSAGTGAVTYGSLAFTPTEIQCYACIGTSHTTSWGICDNALTTGGKSMIVQANGYYSIQNGLIYLESTTNNYTIGSVTAMGTSFTVEWLKTNSPAGTAQLLFLCKR